MPFEKQMLDVIVFWYHISLLWLEDSTDLVGQCRGWCKCQAFYDQKSMIVALTFDAGPM
jgi:hypothetical protein